ncbi:hypothetical protein M514_10502 [Trichuris suis]|uniref:Beta-glucuronidase n=1 Tax=Trichuris suis TaxID=68888 RepID=A0A085MYE3_9BILA|nr:hypothetical protein M514_10502 [Trichuris suis]
MLLAFLCAQLLICAGATMYPFESETREVKSLDGLWCFVSEESNSEFYGMKNKWFQKDICLFENSTRLAVPGSYNDQTQSQLLRRHVGWVWYQKKFFISRAWYSKDKEVLLRFGSVNYVAVVWLNGKLTAHHEGGHLPFQASAKNLLHYGAENILTVAVNNTLSHDTIPPGEFEHKNSSYCRTCDFVQVLNFDFFNYAGIHRSVVLYSVPIDYVKDVIVTAECDKDGKGFLNYSVLANANRLRNYKVNVAVELRTMDDVLIFRQNGLQNSKIIPEVKIWWPYGMSDKPAYLYKFTIILINETNAILDVYHLPIGFRSVRLKGGRFLINDKPFYFAGFGMHEDSEIHGRGYDPVVMVKDMNLLEWFGANSFRTSHYPYSEEMLFEADRRGVVVISELPAVGLRYFTRNNLLLHSSMLKETIGRDRNHPAVVMWSLANEPDTKQNASLAYFRRLIRLAKAMDPTRPLTVVYGGASEYYNDQTASMVDVISMNRYYGWYRNPGHPETIDQELKNDIFRWSDTFKKPILITEYGADTFDSLSFEPAVMFSPQYQLEVFSYYHRVFDSLMQNPLIGEMVWNFADFMTDDSKRLNSGCGEPKGSSIPKQATETVGLRICMLYFFFVHDIPSCPFLKRTQLILKLPTAWLRRSIESKMNRVRRFEAVKKISALLSSFPVANDPFAHGYAPLRSHFCSVYPGAVCSAKLLKMPLAFGTTMNFLFVAAILCIHSLEALRPGVCPQFYGNVAWNSVHRCNYDEQCATNYKCCPTKLGRRCLKPETFGTTTSAPSLKPGTCPPNPSGTSSSASDLCTSDASCELSRKCCPTFVGKRCLLPITSYGQCPDGSPAQRTCSPGVSCGSGFYCSRGYCCPDRGSSVTTTTSWPSPPSLTGCPITKPSGFANGRFCLSSRDCRSPQTCCKKWRHRCCRALCTFERKSMAPSLTATLTACHELQIPSHPFLKNLTDPLAEHFVSLFPSYNLIKRGAVERSALAIASSDCFTETTISAFGKVGLVGFEATSKTLFEMESSLLEKRCFKSAILKFLSAKV